MKLLPIVLIVFFSRTLTMEIIKDHDLRFVGPCEDLKTTQVITDTNELSVEEIVSPGMKW